MDQREKLIAYSYKYLGNTNRISWALKHQEIIEVIHHPWPCIVWGDKAYPKELLDLKNPPWVLFYKGSLEFLTQKKLSIIGSRIAIDYAMTMTKLFIESMQEPGVIVSGLAKGIDACAHEVALNKFSTIAILGCGINEIYPKSNGYLYQQIEKKGLILSEYPPNSGSEKYRFIARNRLIAALGSSLVVMQAALKSGTMSTVDVALSLGKDIYCLPYRCQEFEGEGCNELIKQGAYPLTSVQDFNRL